jgi:superfamily II DNA/RNA helicase
MQRFRDGSASVLVATDVAARGLDVAGVDAVINYSLGGSMDTYVHRIGRCGRAGRRGVAHTLVNPALTLPLPYLET